MPLLTREVRPIGDAAAGAEGLHMHVAAVVVGEDGLPPPRAGLTGSTLAPQSQQSVVLSRRFPTVLPFPADGGHLWLFQLVCDYVLGATSTGSASGAKAGASGASSAVSEVDEALLQEYKNTFRPPAAAANARPQAGPGAVAGAGAGAGAGPAANAGGGAGPFGGGGGGGGAGGGDIGCNQQ